jgi:hypothetical protein
MIPIVSLTPGGSHHEVRQQFMMPTIDLVPVTKHEVW